MFTKKVLLQKDKENFHHGYLLAGDFEISRKMAFEAAEKILDPTTVAGGNDNGCRLKTHPDFFYQKFDLFGIDDSQDLRRKASMRPLFGESKVFVIEIVSFSIESANALLKTFEEPYEGTHFFVLVPSWEDVIPTLRSRLTIIDNRTNREIVDEEKKKFYEKFLRNLPTKRLDMIQSIIRDKNKEKAIAFVNGLEIMLEKSVSLRTDITGNPTETRFFEHLEQIQKCRDFLFQKGGSPKMVLEHLALTLPQCYSNI